MSAPAAVIEGKDLSVKRGGALTLDVPYIDVREGEVLSLIGPNGAGKTTLLQTIAHLVPFAGEIFFRGRKVGRDCPVLAYRRSLAMVFQEPLLFDATVFENAASGLKIRGLKKAAMRDVVMEALSRFGIIALKNRSARSLSGGEAQRTSLARAFAVRPEVMLLDEPFSSLDPMSREPLIEDMEAAVRTTGTTTVLVTHDLMEALRLSDRIAVMDGGRILQAGPAEEVINAPADEFVASFVGTGTLLKGQVDGGRGDDIAVISVAGRQIKAAGRIAREEKVTLYIRPENVTLSIPDGPVGEGPPVTSARNVLPGVVTRVASMGFYQKVSLDCGFPLVSYITGESREALRIAEGRRLTVSFKATAVHVIKKS
jgi:tungstate transport system ATP-binding protein